MLVLDLCFELGYTPAKLLKEMSVDDLVDMSAYRRIKPFGYDVENRRFGQICSAIYNSAGKSFKKDIEWDDIFLPSWKDSDSKKEPESCIDSLLSCFTAMAKKDK